MFKKTIGLLTAGLLSAAALGSFAVANPGEDGPGARGPRGHHGPPPVIHLLKGLELDQNQEAMLDGFKADAKAEREDKRSQVEAIRTAMKAELQSGSPDPAAMHGYIDDLEAVKTEGAHRMMDDFLQVYATLTPEQLAQLTERLDNPPERKRGGPEGKGRRANRGGNDVKGKGKRKGHSKGKRPGQRSAPEATE